MIGLTNPGAFAIGDTLLTGPLLAFPPIPTFSPELFAYLRCPPNQKKPFLKGVEGAWAGPGGGVLVAVGRQVPRGAWGLGVGPGGALTQLAAPSWPKA